MDEEYALLDDGSIHNMNTILLKALNKSYVGIVDIYINK